MDYEISIQVSDGSKERISRRWGTHSGSICELSARCGSRGTLSIAIEKGGSTT